MSVAQDWLQSPEISRLGHSRRGGVEDAVDGITPSLVIEPSSGEELAAAVAWVSRERLATIIRGHGTKLDWGRPPARVDVLLSTARLDRLVAHRHGDLTATIQAGASLFEVNQALAREGQWLPVDTAFDQATIGGIVATNDSGPLRHRYGTPRDLLIGITLALTDGRIVKAGGHVVKNVAGYDLGKLVSGSFGTLAAIVDVTVKLLPIPQTSQTLVVDYTDVATLAADVARLASSQIEPTALDLHVTVGATASSRRLLARFATSPESTAAQIAAARTSVGGAASVVDLDVEAALWAQQVRRPWSGGGVVLRGSWLPAALPAVVALVEEVARTCGVTVDFVGRGGIGAGHLRLEGAETGLTQAVLLLRSRPAVIANVLVLRHGPLSKASVDPWGPPPPTASVLAALKQAFDPAGVLNAGRGVV
jgi:glycolate oxidase FAD binding subunit